MKLAHVLVRGDLFPANGMLVERVESHFPSDLKSTEQVIHARILLELRSFVRSCKGMFTAVHTGDSFVCSIDWNCQDSRKCCMPGIARSLLSAGTSHFPCRHGLGVRMNI